MNGVQTNEAINHKLAIVVHVCHPTMWEAKAEDGESKLSRAIHRKTLSQKHPQEPVSVCLYMQDITKVPISPKVTCL